MDALNEEPVAWLIEYRRPGDDRTFRAVYLHNAVGDYRHIDPDARSAPLYRRMQQAAR